MHKKSIAPDPASSVVFHSQSVRYLCPVKIFLVPVLKSLTIFDFPRTATEYLAFRAFYSCSSVEVQAKTTGAIVGMGESLF